MSDQVRVQVLDDGQVVTIGFKPDEVGRVKHSTNPHPLVTLDFDERDGPREHRLHRQGRSAVVNDGTYHLVCEHAKRETNHGAGPPLHLIVDETLPPDIVLMTPLDIRMCPSDYFDFRQRFAAGQRFDFVPDA